MTMDPEKIKAIDKCQPPTNTKELQMFCSMCNYYANVYHSINILLHLCTIYNQKTQNLTGL